MRNFDRLTKEQRKEVRKARRAAEVIQKNNLRMLGVADFDSINMKRSGRLKTAKIRVR